MNMMKKLMALLLVCVMVLSTSVVVFAAGSVTANPDGLELRFKDDYDNEENTKAAEAVKADPSIALKACGFDADEYTLVTVKDAYVFDTVNNKAITPYEGSISGTLSGVSVKASDKVIVLHFYKSEWVQESASAADGAVTMTMAKGCSPIAVYVKASATTSTGASAGSSPKTGEGSFAGLLLAVMVVAVAGIFVSMRKKTV